MARKVLVQVDDRNPFGEEFDQSILNDPGRDSTYIEGYSDVRRQRELDARDGKRPPPLRHRLQWARAKTLDGMRDDGRRIMQWQVNKRYEMLPYDEAIKLGYKVNENPAITKGEDGNAYLGERVLMYASAKVAAANLKKVLDDTEDLKEMPQRKLEAAVDTFNQGNTGSRAEAFSFLGEDEPTS